MSVPKTGHKTLYQRVSLRSYGDRFVVLEKAVGSAQYERLTLKHIRNLTAPGDKVMQRHLKLVVRALSQGQPRLSSSGARMPKGIAVELRRIP